MTHTLKRLTLLQAESDKVAKQGQAAEALAIITTKAKEAGILARGEREVSACVEMGVSVLEEAADKQKGGF